MVTMNYSDYFDLKYKPNKNDLICLFRITPEKGFDLKKCAIRVASESSNGTWSDLEVPKHVYDIRARVFNINNDLVKIAYPLKLFEKGNMSQILSSISGNIFGMKALKGLRLEDVFWPKKLIKSFKGPKFGLSGVRKLMKIKSRPITATVAKPKVGLYPKEHALIGYESFLGGCDLLKDDENLSNQSFNRFEKRLDATMKMLEKAEKETGEKKGYLVNVTSETEEMKKRIDLVKASGNKFIMIDTLTAGWAATQTVTNYARKNNLAVHAHRAFHAAFDRNPFHGVTMKVIAEVARLQGVDNLHIGALGKLHGDKTYVYQNHIKASSEKNKETNNMLAQDWFGLNKVMPVCSGGLHPGIVKPIMDLIGKDMIIQLGGGVHGHPDGSRAGASAMREAIDAVLMNINVRTYAKTHPNLQRAIDKWGTKIHK